MEYKERYEEAKRLYQTANADQKYVLESLFPELKKSDDEKIRKDIKLALMSMEEELADFYSTHHTSQEEFLSWLEKQGKQVLHTVNERAWLHLVADVLTWKDGIGQYLDDPRVQELAKKLRSEYAQKLYVHALKEVKQEPIILTKRGTIEMLGTLINIFEVNYPDGFYKVNPIGTTNMQGIHSSEIIKWLKSLKQRIGG